MIAEITSPNIMVALIDFAAACGWEANGVMEFPLATERGYLGPMPQPRPVGTYIRLDVKAKKLYCMTFKTTEIEVPAAEIAKIIVESVT